MSRWLWNYGSVGYARQTALNTENTTDGDFTWCPGEFSVPEVTRQLFDIASKTGAVGAFQAPVFGAKRPTITVKRPVYGFKASYDPTAAEPGVTTGQVDAGQVWLGLIMGSASDSADSAAKLAKGVGLAITDYTTATSGSTYANNEVSSSAGSTITVATGHGTYYKVGQMVLFMASASDSTPTVGWIKSISGDVLTLVDAPGNAPSGNDKGFATAVAFQSSQQPQPMTIRVVGDQSAFKFGIVGCIPTKAKISAQAGEPPMLEMTFEGVGVTVYSSGGGLQALTMTPKLPLPLVGNGAGRLTWGTYTGLSMSAQHGVKDLAIEIDCKYNDIMSHNVASGISERIVAERSIKVSMKWPRASGDTITSGDHAWETAIASGTGYQLALYAGSAAGGIFSALFPNLHQAEAPKLVDDGGVLYDELVFRPGVWALDGASTNAGNSNVRFGWG